MDASTHVRARAARDASVEPEADPRAPATVELYRLLAEEVVPGYYRSDEADVPRDWVRKMKASIARLGPAFNTQRMVVEYVEQMYLPAHRVAAQARR